MVLLEIFFDKILITAAFPIIAIFVAVTEDTKPNVSFLVFFNNSNKKKQYLKIIYSETSM